MTQEDSQESTPTVDVVEEIRQLKAMFTRFNRSVNRVKRKKKKKPPTELNDTGSPAETRENASVDPLALLRRLDSAYSEGTRYNDDETACVLRVNGRLF